MRSSRRRSKVRTEPVEGVAARYPSESGRRSLVRRGTDRSADDAGSPAEGRHCLRCAVPALPPITPLSGRRSDSPALLQVPATTTVPPVPALPEPSPAGAPAPATTVAGTSPPAPAAAAPRRRGTSCSVQTATVRIYALRGVSAKGRARPAIGARDDASRPAATTTGVGEDDIHRESGRGRVDAAREWSATGTALTFNVYRAAHEARRRPRHPRRLPSLPRRQAPPKPEMPLNPAPLAATKFELRGWTSDRAVLRGPNGRARPERARSKVTPSGGVRHAEDIFPPAAPQGLELLLLDGAIELVWDASTEADFAGYTVLRADAPGGTLRPLTPSPIRETTFRDTTVRPGARYAYAIVAVDRPGTRARRPPASRERLDETVLPDRARKPAARRRGGGELTNPVGLAVAEGRR